MLPRGGGGGVKGEGGRQPHGNQKRGRAYGAQVCLGSRLPRRRQCDQQGVSPGPSSPPTGFVEDRHLQREPVCLRVPSSSAVGNALYDASGRRTRRRGPTRRERTTRRTVSYKASGPDASGMYDASYSVVQGVVQHQHRTTQYDIVRPPSPSRRVNDGSGPSWGKGAFGPLPKYWHFASTTCRQCLQLAGRVYLWCTVSTDPRPPSPCAECCLIEGGGQSVA